MQLTFVAPRLNRYINAVDQEGDFLLNGIPLQDILERPGDFAPIYCQAALAISSLRIQPRSEKYAYFKRHPEELASFGIEYAG